MTQYYMESFKKSGSRKFMIRQREHKQIEKYDFNRRKWVEDDYMHKIYTGGIDVDPCTEAEALAEIRAIEERMGIRKKGKVYGRMRIALQNFQDCCIALEEECGIFDEDE